MLVWNRNRPRTVSNHDIGSLHGTNELSTGGRHLRTEGCHAARSKKIILVGAPVCGPGSDEICAPSLSSLRRGLPGC